MSERATLGLISHTPAQPHRLQPQPQPQLQSQSLQPTKTHTPEKEKLARTVHFALHTSTHTLAPYTPTRKELNTPRTPPLRPTHSDADTSPLRAAFLRITSPLRNNTTPWTDPLPLARALEAKEKSAGEQFEVCQSGFYFACEISPRPVVSEKKKELFSRTAGRGRALAREKKMADSSRPPSPDLRAEGRVKDILSRNLFGAPVRSRTGLSPPTATTTTAAPAKTTPTLDAHTFPKRTPGAPMPSPSPPSPASPATTLVNASATSSPSTYFPVATSTKREDIGALMAGFKMSVGSRNVDVTAGEGMPTPLRKASERLAACQAGEAKEWDEVLVRRDVLEAMKEDVFVDEVEVASADSVPVTTPVESVPAPATPTKSIPATTTTTTTTRPESAPATVVVTPTKNVGRKDDQKLPDAPELEEHIRTSKETVGVVARKKPISVAAPKRPVSNTITTSTQVAQRPTGSSGSKQSSYTTTQAQPAASTSSKRPASVAAPSRPESVSRSASSSSTHAREMAQRPTQSSMSKQSPPRPARPACSTSVSQPRNGETLQRKTSVSRPPTRAATPPRPASAARSTGSSSSASAREMAQRPTRSSMSKQSPPRSVSAARSTTSSRSGRGGVPQRTSTSTSRPSTRATSRPASAARSTASSSSANAREMAQRPTRSSVSKQSSRAASPIEAPRQPRPRSMTNRSTVTVSPDRTTMAGQPTATQSPTERRPSLLPRSVSTRSKSSSMQSIKSTSNDTLISTSTPAPNPTTSAIPHAPKPRPRSMMQAPATTNPKGPRPPPAPTGKNRPRSMTVLPIPVAETVHPLLRAETVADPVARTTKDKGAEVPVQTVFRKPVQGASAGGAGTISRKIPVPTRARAATATSAPAAHKTPTLAPAPEFRAPATARPQSPTKPTQQTKLNRKPVPPPHGTTSGVSALPRMKLEEANQEKQQQPLESRLPVPKTPRRSSEAAIALAQTPNTDLESYTPVGPPTRATTLPVSPAQPLKTPPTQQQHKPKPKQQQRRSSIAFGSPLDHNALHAPSKELQNSLDRAIDAKIIEDRKAGREVAGGRRISELMAARKGF